MWLCTWLPHSVKHKFIAIIQTVLWLCWIVLYIYAHYSSSEVRALLVLEILWDSSCLRIEYLWRARAILIFFRISWWGRLLTHRILSSLISAVSFLISNWIEMACEMLPFNERMFHCHIWCPALVFVNSQYTLQKVYESIHWVHLTFLNLWLEVIQINLSTFSLGFFVLLVLLFLYELVS